MDEGAADYSLTATFEDSATAERAAAAVRDAGLDVSVTVGAERDERAALDAEMRDEVESAVVGPGNIGPFTKGMTKGLVVWVPIGIVAGALVGLVFGFIPWPNVSTGARFMIWAAAGAFAGATAGFVIGGFAKPRLVDEGGDLEAEAGVIVGVHAAEPGSLERARGILERHGASRADAVGPGGPRGPSDEDAARPVRGDTAT